jgi:hypothetical protein
MVRHGLITDGVPSRDVMKPLVDEAITTITFVCPGAPMLFYRAVLPLSAQTLAYAAGVIRRHRARIGSCWRKCKPGQQALLVLAYLRKGETFAALAAGFGIGTATAWRYVRETVALLAARAPKLPAALKAARKAGYAFVVIDGTLIPIDRVAADRPFYSGKHRKHGMNLQVISSPHGDIVWVSGPLPGRRPRPDRRPDLGPHPPAHRRRAHRAGRQRLHRRRRACPDSVPGPEQTRLLESSELRSRETARSRRTRQRPAQNLGHPPQTPLLPLAGRPARQSHPCPPNPRDQRMKNAHWFEPNTCHTFSQLRAGDAGLRHRRQGRAAGRRLSGT